MKNLTPTEAGSYRVEGMVIQFKDDKKEKYQSHECTVDLSENTANFDITSYGQTRIEAANEMITMLETVKDQIDDAIKAIYDGMSEYLVDRGTYYEIKNYKPIVELDDQGNITSVINCPYIPKFL